MSANNSNITRKGIPESYITNIIDAPAKDSKYKFAILTVSDRCSLKEAIDESGPLLVESINQLIYGEAKCLVIDYRIVPDDRDSIKTVLLEWCRGTAAVDCIITTGGTGFTERDVTPEATKEVIIRDAPGIVHALINGSLKKTPMAMLSRLSAGIRNKTLIINFPGSKKACHECFAIVKPILKHAIDQLVNDRMAIDTEHKGMAMKSKIKRIPVANRCRQSPYEMISMDAAMNIILNEIGNLYKESDPSQFTETVSAKQLHLYSGYVLAADVYALVPLPPFNSSIKDGYAVIAADGVGTRTVLSASVAGGQSPPTLRSGYCVRISTGAAVPPGADAVVQVEDTDLITTNADNEEETISINSCPTVGQDIRPIGCDIPVSDSKPLLKKYTSLDPIELGLIASTGTESITVYRKPTIAVLSTGDEIVSQGEARPPNCIWDSNRATLLSLLNSSNYKVVDLGISPDNVDDIFRNIKRGLECCDVLITSGGVSMGERDLLKQVLKEDFLSEIHFGRVNIKPGKPTTFATCVFNNTKKFIFALPGNPVSAYVMFQVFVKPSLELLTGKYFSNSECVPPQNTVLSVHKTIKCQLKLPENYNFDKRPEFCRAIVSFSSDLQSDDSTSRNLPVAQLTEANQISSRLLNVRDANALVLCLHQSVNPKSTSIIADAILM